MVRQTTNREIKILDKIRECDAMSNRAYQYATTNDLNNASRREIETKNDFLCKIFDILIPLEAEYILITREELPKEQLNTLNRLDKSLSIIYSQHLKNKSKNF